MLIILFALSLFTVNFTTQPIHPASQQSLENENRCCVCLEPAEEIDENMTECHHIIHPECLSAWITASGKNECPLCRQYTETIERRRLYKEKRPPFKKEAALIILALAYAVVENFIA